METRKAQTGWVRALGDQVWAAARKRKREIDRIAQHGPDGSEGDNRLCRFLAILVKGNLSFGSEVADNPDL